MCVLKEYLDVLPLGLLPVPCCLNQTVIFCFQPVSPSFQRRLKQLTDKHGSAKIYQVVSSVVGSRDLDLNLNKGELVAVISEADTRGDKRRWLVDAGGENASTVLRSWACSNVCLLLTLVPNVPTLWGLKLRATWDQVDWITKTHPTSFFLVWIKGSGRSFIYLFIRSFIFLFIYK